MHFLYLFALILSITGLALLDHRFKLAFWYDRKRTLLTLGCAVGVFLLWDILGIFLGIFIHGNSPYSLAFTLFKEFPVEEFFFLFLLCYSALVLYRGGERWHSRTSS